MTAVAFPSEEALVAAITSQLVSKAELVLPVRHWRVDEVCWVRPLEPLGEATVERLAAMGVKITKKKAPRRASSASNWLEVVATHFVAEPSDPLASVMFLLDEPELLTLAGEMLRLGCDRQRYRLGDAACLLVEAPPYYSTLRALDSASGVQAFVPGASERVWVELGCEHPLADRVRAAEGELVLISRGGWRRLDEGAWRDVDELVELELPGDEHEVVMRELEGKLRVVLRLARTGSSRPAVMWVVREQATAQVESMLQDLPSHVVDSLLFAVHEDMVVLRAREGAPVIELALRAERYAPHPLLPTLLLPCDATLEPPLSRARLQSVLARQPGSVCWLRPAEGGTFLVEHAQGDAFRPLSEWVDYVIAHHEATIEPWARAAIFDLDDIARVELAVPREVNLHARKPEPKQPAAGTPAKARKPRKLKANKAAPVEVETLASPLPKDVEPSEAARRAAELEQQFLELDAAGDSEARMSCWRELAHAYGAAGQLVDAAHAYLRVMWEQPPDEQRRLAGEWAQCEGGGALASVVDIEWPSIGDMRLFVARLCEERTDDGNIELERLAKFLDLHQDGLDVRSRWLAHVAISRRGGGDTLRLTRARDYALSQLRGGLSLDRDVPSFIRARATGHGDHAVADMLVAELEQLWQTYAGAKRQRSAIEAPLATTATYARRLFAYGFARLGRAELARRLLKPEDGDADRADAVHDLLLSMLDERVRQGTRGLSPTTPLPAEITASLNALGTFERYKVDRLREASAVLEPVERLSPIPGYMRGEADPRGDMFAPLRALDAGPELSARIGEIVRQACSPKVAADKRAALLDSAMDFFFLLPVSQATALLEEVARSLEPVAPFQRALLVEEALVLAAHFGHEPLVPQLAAELESLIAAVGAEHAVEVGRVLAGALRTLRRVGLNDAAASLLNTALSVTDGAGPELMVARVHVAGGFVFLGAIEKAVPVFDEVRKQVQSDTIPIKERLELTRAVSQAVALLPVQARVRELRELSAQLSLITDSFSTNSHFCLSLLHFLESLITGLVPPDRGRDGPAAVYLDEDENLVRRRIHRELRATTNAA